MKKLSEQKKHSLPVNAPHVYQKLVIYAAVNLHQQRIYQSANKKKI